MSDYAIQRLRRERDEARDFAARLWAGTQALRRERDDDCAKAAWDAAARVYALPRDGKYEAAARKAALEEAAQVCETLAVGFGFEISCAEGLHQHNLAYERLGVSECIDAIRALIDRDTND